MVTYDKATEAKMLLHFSQLNEKEKRFYASMEALRLGYGGQKYIVELFRISDYRVRAGITELNNPELLDEIPKGKIRREGGGRKKKKSVIPK